MEVDYVILLAQRETGNSIVFVVETGHAGFTLPFVEYSKVPSSVPESRAVEICKKCFGANIFTREVVNGFFLFNVTNNDRKIAVTVVVADKLNGDVFENPAFDKVIASPWNSVVGILDEIEQKGDSKDFVIDSESIAILRILRGYLGDVLEFKETFEKNIIPVIEESQEELSDVDSKLNLDSIDGDKTELFEDRLNDVINRIDRMEKKVANASIRSKNAKEEIEKFRADLVGVKGAMDIIVKRIDTLVATVKALEIKTNERLIELDKTTIKRRDTLDTQPTPIARKKPIPFVPKTP